MPAEILDPWAQTPAGSTLIRRVESGGVVPCPDVPPAAAAGVVAGLRRLFPRRVVVVVAETLKAQEILHTDLSTWVCPEGTPVGGPGSPLFFAPWEVLPQDGRPPHADIVSERLETLVGLPRPGETRGAAPLVVASVTALLQPTFPPGELARRTRVLRRGDTLNPLDLIEWLEAQGYEPEAQVTHKGELSWRGGIVDVWPLSAAWPVRLEFFGDELESLREFDPQAQTSREVIEVVTIPPAGELSVLHPRNRLMEVEPAPSGPPPAVLLEHLPPGSLVVLVDPAGLETHAEGYEKQVPADHPLFRSWRQLRELAAERGLVTVELRPPGEALPEETTGVHPVGLGPLPPGLGFESLEAYRPIGVSLPDPQVADAQRRAFFQQLHRWLRQGHAVEVFCGHEGERERFGELWKEYGLAGPGVDGGPAEAFPAPRVRLGLLSRGFRQDGLRLVVVSDAEIYGRYKVQRPRRLKSRHAQAARSAFEIDFTDFDEGDFVVHVEHGIALYRGLKTLPPARARGGAVADAGSGQECLVLEYAATGTGDEPPRLYVPVSEAHLVSRYVGAGKARPQLSTLGGARWAKAKEQAQRAVRDLAADLLAIQAARTTQPGVAFPSDTPWQREFEASFEFEETPDQLRAIEAAKRDMETAKPMDRLLCGDVGFGKTEVAIRAAFKAVMSGKQVAVLVPTTVLAQQHYRNFRERMAEYPVHVEVLSRFRTAGQQRAIVQAAREGAVDILIGTHRVASPDVGFKDLGLVIVDEEQKFGVRHKEQLKRLRQTVDVLTLSATPIPRTLYLALTGARDLSTLETPPQDRLPVETIVTNYDERQIRDALRRELNRGGQVYYLHNRVSTIEGVALRLRDLVPDARIVVGHGQMDPDDLERVMTRFVDGEADILVSTTIIESGLDIPNANTMIIDRADRFGLSELYQLRGRVGRYKHQAYCLLLLPRHAQLLTEARKRMSAIKQYSALGSGFKIAMRDLEIRGAGNLLGAEQSGHITAVGFDLYCQLLARSISALKGEPLPVSVQVRVSLDFLAFDPSQEAPAEAATPKPKPGGGRKKLRIEVPREVATVADFDEDSDRSLRDAPVAPPTRAPAYLPLDYLREPTQRVEVYRQLAQIRSRPDLESLRASLRDRFGPLPGPVEMLLQVADLRLLAAEKRVSSVEVTDGKVKLTRNRDLITVGGQFPRLTRTDPKGRLTELRRLLLSLN